MSHKLDMKQIIIIICVTIALIFSSVLSVANVNKAWGDDKDEAKTYTGNPDDDILSLQKDFFMGVIAKNIKSGLPMLQFTDTYEETRKDINYKLAKGEDPGKHSLYDRFGGNINFSMYLGEEVVKTSLVDKIYTWMSQRDDTAKGPSITDVLDMVTRKDSVYTNVFYKGRPPLLTAFGDPRVSRYKYAGLVTPELGVELASANYFLDTAKLIVEVVTYFVNGTLIDQLHNIIHSLLDNNIVQSLRPVFDVLFIVIGIGIIFFILRFCMSFLKKGNVSLKQFFVNLVCSLFSLGLVAMLVVNPGVLVDVTYKVLGLGKDIIAKGIDASSPSEIVDSGDDTNKATAAIWEKAIFEPWVMGTFGSIPYNKLYTTYAKVDDNNKWSVPDYVAKEYGDIKVKRGGGDGKDIKNWAALAYSCHSIYHLNATKDDEDQLQVSEQPEEKNAWPKAPMPSYNKSVYADDFRWIDAGFKVGATKEGGTDSKLDVSLNGYDSNVYRPYKFDGLINAWKAIWFALLTIPLGILGVKKTVSGLVAIASFCVLLYRSFLNAMFPNKEQFSIISAVKATLKPIVSYFFYVILVFFGLTLFQLIGTSENILLQLVYLGLTIYMCTLRWEGLPQIGKSLKKSAMNVVSWGKDIKDEGLRGRYSDFKNKIPRSVRDYNANEGKGEDIRKSVEQKKREIRGEEDYEKGKDGYENKPIDETKAETDDVSGMEEGTLSRIDYLNGDLRRLEEKVKRTRSISEQQRKQALAAYKELCDGKQGFDRAQDVEAICAHRSNFNNRQLDHLILGIDPDEYAIGANYNQQALHGGGKSRLTNETRNQMKFDIATGKYNARMNKLDRKKEKIDAKIEKKKEQGKWDDEKIEKYKKKIEEKDASKREGEKKKLGRKGKRLEKRAKSEEKWGNVQNKFNAFTGGNFMNGSTIPLWVKIKILKWLLIAYALGWVIYVAVG